MDRLTEMEAFATVVDQGGFTDAAKKMGISKSAVSKHVSSLEARLGARLLNRTTRRVSPTEIGLAYYDRARRVLNDAGEADALVTSMQSAPSGLLRISVATDFGVNHLSPVLGEFLQEFPEITVNMVLNNRYVELISEGFDLAVRIGELEDSTLRARQRLEADSPFGREASGSHRRLAHRQRRSVAPQCGHLRSRHRLPAIFPLRGSHGAGPGHGSDPGIANGNARHLCGLSSGPVYPA